MARLKPLPRSQRHILGRKLNRGHDVSRRDDDVKDISVGLMDVDAAIMYYFNEVIKPTAIEQGETIKVPVLYSNPERWKSVKKDGYLRDTKRQIITPLIVFKRSSMAKDDSMPIDKTDANDPKNFYTFEKRFTQKQRYDQFAVQQGLIPTKEIYTVAMPDFMTLTYECIIWTAYIEQMNKIVELINYSDGSYWGEPGKFKFKVNIESFEDATEFGDNERIIKTTFGFSFRGYLIPESFNNYINTQKAFTPRSVNVVDETNLSVSSLYRPDRRAQDIRIFGTGGGSAPGGLGSATDFIRGVSSGVGVETQDLEFTNTFGGATMYIMRGNGEPSSSVDIKAIINQGYANRALSMKMASYSGSDSGSTYPGHLDYSLASGSSFSVTLDSGYKISAGSVKVQVNGVDLYSHLAQTQKTVPAEFWASGSVSEPSSSIVINKNITDATSGIDLIKTDKVIINYQQMKK